MVAAQETTFQALLGGAKQYQVPLYQRTYSWKEEHRKKLWEDIVQLAEDRRENPDATHFIGSLVLALSPAASAVGVQDFLVIDGQQRLTTLSLLLCALRDHLGQSDSDARSRISDLYLINRYHKDRHTKLQPTQADRAAYLAAIDNTAQAGGVDEVGATYRFFADRLAALPSGILPADIEDALMSGLTVVCVTAGHGDNAYRIFESLNNTGLTLNQADLLRNYLFMHLPTRGEAAYESLWLPLQDSLGENLETLFWLDLVQRDPRAKQGDTYAGQQRRLSELEGGEAAVESELARFNRLGALYAKILTPALEANESVRERLLRLQAWDSRTAHPVLLYLLDLRDQGAATADQVARSMLYLESFFVRRLLAGRATANLNRILADLAHDVRQRREPVDEAIRSYLSTGRKFYANDAEITQAVVTIPFYLNGRAHQRKLVLQWLEQRHGSQEPVDPTNLTIEHVLPQTLTSAWRAELAPDLDGEEDVEDVHSALMHTLGNLTLTGYNGSLGNASFSLKREKLKISGLAMNQEIAAEHRWGRKAITVRAEALAAQSISIWPGPIGAQIDADGLGRWALLTRVLAVLPAGRWTSYGDIAALIGTNAQSVGNRLATVQVVPNAHRVLRANGTVSPSFRWLDGRDDSPRDILEAEGVIFNSHSRANPNQRLHVTALAALISDEPS